MSDDLLIWDVTITGFVSRKRQGHMWLLVQKEHWRVRSKRDSNWFLTREAAYASLRHPFWRITEEIKPFSDGYDCGLCLTEEDY